MTKVAHCQYKSKSRSSSAYTLTYPLLCLNCLLHQKP